MSPQQPPQPSQTPSTLSAMPPAGAQSHDAAGTTLAASASTREGTAAMAAIGVTVAEPAAAPGQAAAAGKRNWFGWLTTSRDNSPHDASTTPLYTGPTTAEQREAMLQITQTPLPQTQQPHQPPLAPPAPPAFWTLGPRGLFWIGMVVEPLYDTTVGSGGGRSIERVQLGQLVKKKMDRSKRAISCNRWKRSEYVQDYGLGKPSARA